MLRNLYFVIFFMAIHLQSARSTHFKSVKLKVKKHLRGIFMTLKQPLHLNLEKLNIL